MPCTTANRVFIPKMIKPVARLSSDSQKKVEERRQQLKRSIEEKGALPLQMKLTLARHLYHGHLHATSHMIYILLDITCVAFVDSRLPWVRGLHECSRRCCCCTSVRRSHSTRNLGQLVCTRFSTSCCCPTHFGTVVVPFMPTSCNGSRTCVHEICSYRDLCSCRDTGWGPALSAHLVSLTAGGWGGGACCSARLTATQRCSLHDPGFDGKNLTLFAAEVQSFHRMLFLPLSAIPVSTAVGEEGAVACMHGLFSPSSDSGLCVPSEHILRPMY